MILTSGKIKEAVQKGEISFSPNLDVFQIQPDSVDLRLGWSFYIPETWEYTDEGRVAVRADYLELQKNKQYFRLVKLKPGQYFEIMPNEFIIISTLEKINLGSGKYAALCLPRSSALRRGLSIDGGVVDAHFEGHLTIPVKNSTNHMIKLYPGERVVQLVIQALSDEMTREEAMKHGLQAAKYMNSTPYGLEARSDSEEEVSFIRKGAIEEMKSKFAHK